ncbi:MAG: TIGR01841 family phasin [Caulobacteraceae bacterium]
MKNAENATSKIENANAAGVQAMKDQVEKSMATIGELNAHSRKNLEAVVASVTAATKGAESLGALAMAYSKKTLEEGVGAAKTLANAKSLQEAVEFQTSFAKTAFESYISEMTKMSETVAASMKEAMAPINERVTALIERAQTTH